jgi:hypothetical protein
MPRPTLHQIICRRTKNGLKYTIPKKITTDVGFQLMFGSVENYWVEEKRIKINAENYETNIFRNLEHIKRII